jgi:hypothetical protein
MSDEEENQSQDEWYEIHRECDPDEAYERMRDDAGEMLHALVEECIADAKAGSRYYAHSDWKVLEHIKSIVELKLREIGDVYERENSKSGSSAEVLYSRISGSGESEEESKLVERE